MMGWDSELLRRFAEATHAKKAAETALNAATKIIDECDPMIQEMFMEEGVPSAKIATEAFDADAETKLVIRSAVNQSLREVAGRQNAIDPATGQIVDVDAMIVDALRDAGLLVDSRPKKTTTISIGSRLWARPVVSADADDNEKAIARAAAVEALKDNGYGMYVKEDFNMIALSSAIKNAREEDPNSVPLGTEFFDGKIDVKETFKVSARVKNG